MALYASFLRNALIRGAALGAPVKAALMGDFNQDIGSGSQAWWLDIRQYERASIVGYPMGGVAVSPLLPVWDADSETIGLSCEPVDFGLLDAGSLGISAVALYADTGTAATSPLISVDFLSIPAYPLGQDFTYRPDDTGVISLQIVDDQDS